jgi:hypothetical protein
MRKLFLILFLTLTISLNGQKHPLNHSVYDDWKSVNQPLISDNGEWTAFTQVEKGKKDGYNLVTDN